MNPVAGTGHRRDWRATVAILVALMAVGAALALPTPPPPPTVPTPAGPARLADVWPRATPIAIASALPDGSSLQPLLVLDNATTVGVATSSDLSGARLVVRPSDGPTRRLRGWTGAQSVTIAAVTATRDTLYWLERSSASDTDTGDDDSGDAAPVVALWRAELVGGEPRRLAVESTDLLYYDSGHDLQIVDGKAIWAVVGAEGHTEIHSVPVDGGPVGVRALDQRYALSAWPWVTTSTGSRPGDVELLNIIDGQRRTVTAGPDEFLMCTPQWCRITTLVNQRQALRFEVERADGGQRRKIGDTTLTPINNDVGLLDTFEVLASAASADGSGYGQNLWLLDLTTGTQALLASDATSSIGSRGPYLWWSTGDNETLRWHILDLRQCTSP